MLKKILWGIVIIVVLVVIVAVVVVPRLIDVDRYRPWVAEQIQQQTGKPTRIGRLTLTVRPTLAIRVDDFAMRNPSGFPEGDFISARRVYVAVDSGALWDRKVIVKALELNDPAITLYSDVRGRWNFENPPPSTPTKAASPDEPSSFSLGVINNVKITGGKLSVADLLPSGRPGPAYFELRGVSSQLERFDINAYTTTASVPAGHLDSMPSRPARVGWTSLAYAASPAPQPAAEGALRASFLRFGNIEVSNVKSNLRLYPKEVFFDNLDFDAYDGHATGNLSFNYAGENLRYGTQARINNIDVAKLLRAFPSASGKMTGRMDGQIRLSGRTTHSPDPLAGIRGTGELKIRDGQIPGLQLNRNLMLLARFADLGAASGDPSSFQSISADLKIADEKITSEKIVIVGSGVDIEGSGSLGLGGAGSLDYQGVAKLSAGKNSVTNVMANLTGSTFSDGKLSVPFTLTGTMENPKFNVKPAGGAGRLGVLQSVAGAATGQTATTQGQQAAPATPAETVKGIVGLFKKKKPAEQQTSPAPSAP